MTNAISPAKHRILVVDDHQFFRDGLVQWIGRQPDLECCGEAVSVTSGLSQIAALKPDLVLLDLQLSESDGFDLLKQVVPRAGAPRIIVLSQKDSKHFGVRAIKAGARGYIMKDLAAENLRKAIDTVLGGGIYVSDRLRKLLQDSFTQGEPASQFENLSDRELQVFEMLGRAMTGKAIAEALGISPKTVDTYRESLKVKLGFSDGVALLQAATLWVNSGHSPKA